MKDHFTKDKIKGFLAAAAITATAGILAVLDLYKCPSDHLFGIPCPMCGLTRALLAVAQGDLQLSFYYYPLWPLIVIAVAAYVLYYFGFIRISGKIFRILAILLAFCIIACFVYRHMTDSPIVRLHTENCFFSGIFW